MDDLQLIIYIALAVIYFIARALRPKKPTRPPMQKSDKDYDQDSTPDIPGKERPMTFEELLQEFTGEREVSSSPEVKTVEEQFEEIQEDDEIRSYEGYDDYKTSEYAQYEQQYGEAKELKTLDEQVSIEEPVIKAFENYEVRNDEAAQAKKFRNLLQNQEGLKDAIVLKEILEPRYF